MKKLKFLCDHKDDQIAQFTLVSASSWFDYFVFFILIVSLSLIYSSFDGEKKAKDFFSFWWICLWMSSLGSFSFIIYSLLFSVSAETLIIAAPIGIQLMTSFKLRPDIVTFLPWKMVKEFLILEVFTCQKVVFVLALMKREEGKEDKLEILFPGTKPRLQHLEKIYQVSRRIVEKNSSPVKSS
nr:PREDICTED: uncharacterized protein LOC109034994 [Bemisia tabaci]